MKATLEKLAIGETLSRSESNVAMEQFISGDVLEVQLASFLSLLRSRPVTLDELSGFHDVLAERQIKVDLGDETTIDLCGTGGDGKGTFNISTLSSFIVAGAGGRVVKHGNYGLSSLCGSSTVLEELGIPLTADVDVLKRSLERASIAILHAPLFQPALKVVAPLRRTLGIRTIFNLLGPILNPARPICQVIGCTNQAVLRMYSYFLMRQGKDFAVVSSEDGYDEVSLTAPFRMRTGRSERHYSPESLQFKRWTPEDLFGGDSVASHSKIFMSILEGNGTEAQNQVVIANAGIALHVLHSKQSLQDCFERAKESLVSGAALRRFQQLRAVSS